LLFIWYVLGIMWIKKGQQIKLKGFETSSKNIYK